MEKNSESKPKLSKAAMMRKMTEEFCMKHGIPFSERSKEEKDTTPNFTVSFKRH